MSVRVENRRTEPKAQIPFYFTKRYLWLSSLRNPCPKSLAIFIFFKIRESWREPPTVIFRRLSKNIAMFRESLRFTKKSYGIEILSVHFLSLCVSKEDIGHQLQATRSDKLQGQNEGYFSTLYWREYNFFDINFNIFWKPYLWALIVPSIIFSP